MGMLLLAASEAQATAMENAWRPTYTLVEPLCQATDWNQSGNLNYYVNIGGGEVCGCDPLAWGQVVTYHALNHGFPAADWEPTPVTSFVYFGTKEVERTTMSGTYDWEAIRDKTALYDSAGTILSVPVGRLMWDLGVLGHTQYDGDYGSAGTSYPTLVNYFGYKGAGYPYTAPSQTEVEGSDWDILLMKILRTSVQLHAPVVLNINLDQGMHMVVVDGFGLDDDGTAWFHVDYGWFNSAGKWWDMAEMRKRLTVADTLVYPTEDLGSVIVGRVVDNQGNPMAGETVSLTGTDVSLTATTDENGAYTFSGLPLVDTDTLAAPDALLSATYTLSVQDTTQTVTLGAFIDDDLRATKQDAYEELTDKAYTGRYPNDFGGAVCDLVISTEVYVAPGGTGSGISWDAPAPFSQATLNAAAGKTVCLAEGEYTFSSMLEIPANTTVKGGYSLTTFDADVLGSPSVLTYTGSADVSAYIHLLKGAVLEGVHVTGDVAAPEIFYGYERDKVFVRNCILLGEPKLLGESVTFETCIIAGSTIQLSDCALTHCTVVGTLEDINSYAVSTTLGTLTGVKASAVRPKVKTLCTGCTTCPETGLDGRALQGQMGALTSDQFDLPIGFTLRLQ